MIGIVEDMRCTVQDMLEWAGGCFSEYRIPSPEVEAEYLLSEIFCCKKGELYLRRGDRLAPDEFKRFSDGVKRRMKGEPLQYIIEKQEFWGLDFKVTSDVLIPRPETEHLVEEAINEIRGQDSGYRGQGVETRNPISGTRYPKLILDLCTGSGCIAVSIASEIPEVSCFAIDISDAALQVASENAAVHGVLERIEFIEGDLFEPLEGKGLKRRIDIVVANPPYIKWDTIPTLQTEIRDFEPEVALRGGRDGLDFYRRIIFGAPDYLSEDGFLLMEVGYGQSGAVRAIFEDSGYTWAVDIKKDYAGIDRVVKARVSIA
ncbi:MAG: peptide chain release factor N(5)-glutamine methyltransferase [Thermodesulfobacteriota bacterium]